LVVVRTLTAAIELVVELVVEVTAAAAAVGRRRFEK